MFLDSKNQMIQFKKRKQGVGVNGGKRKRI
jgi:hypothetical protein